MVSVKNLNNSSVQFPKPTCKCKTWIEHWNLNRYPNNEKQAGWCRGCGKKISPSSLVGGHVMKRNPVDKARYIVPLCSSCNNTKDLIFDVDNSDLISANCDNCINP